MQEMLCESEAEISLFAQQPLLCRHEGHLEETPLFGYMFRMILGVCVSLEQKSGLSYKLASQAG